MIVAVAVLALWAMIEIYGYFEDDYRWRRAGYKIERTIDRIVDKFD